ncbi:MAG: transporter [Verrucomicrobia bacterium]|jgi:Cu(I)/Ag(I) efflux system membrane fusion protein|nr:transporter [Verrucomicrobiota bacterium]
MKPIPFILVVLAIGGAAFGGYYYATHKQGGNAGKADASGRKVKFYQSAMHPWIKSDKPGKCTICGMELTPVYEGEKGIESAAGVVALGSNSIQVINVQTTPAAKQPLMRSFRFAGTIDDDDSRHRILSAYVKGRIDELFVNYVGAEVTEGQPLAKMYSPMLLAAEREYAGLARNMGQGEDTKRLLAIAKSRLTQYGLGEKQIVALVEKKSDDLHTEIISPMTGTVVARKVYAGQSVAEGEALFEIADFSKMWLQFDAYEQDLAWLKVGQEVEITTPSVPNKVFKTAITFIDPNLNMMTRSAKVRVEIPNPVIEADGVKRRELSHRLYAEARVKVDSVPTLVVPRSAILMAESGKALLYIDKGRNAYEQRTVKLGRAADGVWEILEGLKEGEAVVTQGNLLIDAQAQLNASASPTAPQAPGETAAKPAGTNAVAATLPALTAEQAAAVSAYLKLADAITASLAADNLAEYNTQASKTHTATPVLVKAFASDSPWRKLVDPIEKSGHLPNAADLTAARKTFHQFSIAVVDLAQALRRQETAFKSLKVFRCPMTKDAFEGAPRTADWMQLNPTLRNPYFGAEMLECGVEVKP